MLAWVSLGISIVLLTSEQRLQILFPIPVDLNIFWHLRQDLSFATSEVVLGRGDMKYEFLSVRLGLSDITISSETHLSCLACVLTLFVAFPTWDTSFHFGRVTSEARRLKREICIRRFCPTAQTSKLRPLSFCPSYSELR